MTIISFIRSTEKLSEPLFEQLLSRLSAPEVERIQKFRFWHNRQQSLLGKLLLRRILFENYKIRQISNIFYDRYSRPYQKDKPGIDFNISHSGEWVICGTTDTGRIGVDVEKIRPLQQDVAKRFFAKEENDYLSTIPEDERLDVFYHIWTLKEAYIKARGETFHIPLSQFWFDLRHPAHPVIHFKDIQDTDEWRFSCYDIDPFYRFSVCCSAGDDPIHIRIQSLKELL
jgi:4'-phosphopantetheinyl transferase